MARFDLYRNRGANAEVIPFLLDVQSGLLDGLDTRVVVPLRRRDSFPPAELSQRLTPVFEIEGHPCMMETPKLAAVPLAKLGPASGSLETQRDLIVGALDFLLNGY